MLKKVMFGAGTLAAALAFATPAQASFVVLISDGTNSVSLADNQLTPVYGGSASCAGGDSNPTSGIISVAGCTIGSFVFGQLALTNTPGGPNGGALTSQALLSYDTTSQQVLQFVTFADGYTDPGSAGSTMSFSSSLSGTTALLSGSPSVTFLSSADGAGGTSFSSPTGPQVCSGITAGSLTTSCAGAANATGFFLRTGATYSLLNQITIDTGLGASSATAMQITGATAATVPEPGSMMLLGTGLFGVARFARRRFNLV